MPSSYLGHPADAGAIANVLRGGGAVATRNLVEQERAKAVATELGPELDPVSLKPASIFNGALTRHCGLASRTGKQLATTRGMTWKRMSSRRGSQPGR